MYGSQVSAECQGGTRLKREAWAYHLSLCLLPPYRIEKVGM